MSVLVLISRLTKCLSKMFVQGHVASLQKESQGEKIAQLLPDLKDLISGLVDWSYLHRANCTLLECRRVLSNAYVFAFFMFNAENFLEVSRT